MVLDKKIFYVFPYISLCKHVTPGAGPFLAPGAQFEQDSRLYGFRQGDFLCPPYISLYVKHGDSRGWAIFGPRGII